VRLAAKLTGWKIDVRSESAPEAKVEGGVQRRWKKAKILKKKISHKLQITLQQKLLKQLMNSR